MPPSVAGGLLFFKRDMGIYFAPNCINMKKIDGGWEIRGKQDTENPTSIRLEPIENKFIIVFKNMPEDLQSVPRYLYFTDKDNKIYKLKDDADLEPGSIGKYQGFVVSTETDIFPTISGNEEELFVKLSEEEVEKLGGENPRGFRVKEENLIEINETSLESFLSGEYLDKITKEDDTGFLVLGTEGLMAENVYLKERRVKCFEEFIASKKDHITNQILNEAQTRLLNRINR